MRRHLPRIRGAPYARTSTRFDRVRSHCDECATSRSPPLFTSHSFPTWDLFCGRSDVDPKLLRGLRAWGGVMKNSNPHFLGMTKAIGYSMYLQGCHEPQFKITNDAGISCSYSTVTAGLKQVKSQLVEVSLFNKLLSY